MTMVKEDPRAPKGLFYPEVILNMRLEELANVIRKLIAPRSHVRAAKTWLDIASKLRAKYGSDPRNITPTKRSFQ